MERYFPKVAKASSSSTSTLKKPRYHPYESHPASPSQSSSSEAKGDAICANRKLSVKELSKGLLRSLASDHNPITHSDARDRADRVVSVSTGHQISEERQNRRLYLRDREKKLKVQSGLTSSSIGVLRTVRVYLSGYLNGTTDIEMKRIIVEAGGQTVAHHLESMVPSQCTHIVTSQWLSGSKTHHLLTGKKRNTPHVVCPEWVFESIAKGKMQPERSYAISLDNTHKLRSTDRG